MTQYEILLCDTALQMRDSVKYYLNDGWSLYGNLVVHGVFKKEYFQAMIKEEKPKTSPGPLETKSRTKN